MSEIALALTHFTPRVKENRQNEHKQQQRQHNEDGGGTADYESSRQ